MEFGFLGLTTLLGVSPCFQRRSCAYQPPFSAPAGPGATTVPHHTALEPHFDSPLAAARATGTRGATGRACRLPGCNRRGCHTAPRPHPHATERVGLRCHSRVGLLSGQPTSCQGTRCSGCRFCSITASDRPCNGFCCLQFRDLGGPESGATAKAVAGSRAKARHSSALGPYAGRTHRPGMDH